MIVKALYPFKRDGKNVEVGSSFSVEEDEPELNFWLGEGLVVVERREEEKESEVEMAITELEIEERPIKIKKRKLDRRR